MSVDLAPAELGFKRPFTQEVSQVLRLHNPNSDPVAFKVKTTAPKQYCVRPNSGRIEAGRDVEVQVLLQAMKEDPPPDARCRDKFLVQSVAISADKDISSNVAQVWANIEQTAKSSIQEKKIRVNFLPSDGDLGPATATNGLSHHDEELPTYSSPSPAAVTPQRNAAAAPVMASKSTGESSEGNLTRSAFDTAAAAVASTTGISESELKRQLDEAKTKIQQLQTQAAEATGLRQRKTGAGSADSSSTSSIQAAPPAGGVPVQIVAGLCLLCFLIAYLFF